VEGMLGDTWGNYHEVFYGSINLGGVCPTKVKPTGLSMGVNWKLCSASLSVVCQGLKKKRAG